MLSCGEEVVQWRDGGNIIIVYLDIWELLTAHTTRFSGVFFFVPED